MIYSDFQLTISSLLAMQDVAGQGILNPLWPRIVEAAEFMMYRDPDLDFLSTRLAATSPTAVGVRSIPIPGEFVVIEGLSLITPAGVGPTAGAALPAGAQRIPLLRTSREFIDAIWPNESAVATPAPFQGYYAIFSEQASAFPSGVQFFEANQCIVAPTPDAIYTAEFTGTFRPAPLSVATPQTFISVNLPDLMVSAAMIWATGGVLRNFGAQADNPQQAVSWKVLYEQQKTGAAVEEARKKSASSEWSPFTPGGVAHTSRAVPAPVQAPGA